MEFCEFQSDGSSNWLLPADIESSGVVGPMLTQL